MRKQSILLVFLCILSLAPVSAQISHSIVPSLETLENAPPEKYSHTYKLRIDASLKRRNEKIRVVSYNILFNLFDHQLKSKSHCWIERLPKIIASIQNIDPDILCIQEAYPSQLDDLRKAFEPDFASFVGSSTQGELNAIFYKKDRFLLDTENYQLDSVNVSSASFDLPLNPKDDPLVAKIPDFLPPNLEPGRQLTLAHFQDKLTGKTFAIINTHLTYYRINSREDQAYFIKKLAQTLQALHQPVIVAGDLNTFPNHPDRPKLPFYDGNYVCQILQTALKDSKEIALLGHIGPTSTGLHDFLSRGSKPFGNQEDSDVILDHIFVSPEITVLVNATEPSQVDNSFPSDHFPLIADVLLP